LRFTLKRTSKRKNMSLFSSKKTTKEEITKTDTTTDAKEAASMKDLYSEVAPKKVATKAGAKVSKVANEAYRVLVSPLVTEKATALHEENKYVFVVANDANKISVAQAIQSVYGVSPKKVNISNIKGKAVSRGNVRGRRSDWRKAVVTLAKGETIKIYEGV